MIRKRGSRPPTVAWTISRSSTSAKGSLPPTLAGTRAVIADVQYGDRSIAMLTEPVIF